MKILLPTAKEMNLKAISNRPADRSQETQKIVQELAQISAADLAKHYKIKLEPAQKEAERWQALLKEEAVTYPAWNLFDGLMYRQMTRDKLTEAQERYLKEHVFITSALYGVINVFDAIAPHRLDFLMGFKVNDSSLKAFWRKHFDRAVQEDELIISLLSSEFETVFSRSIQDRMVRLKFVEETDGQHKTHSTISKKGRGQCLNALVKAEIQDIEALKELCFEGFEYCESLSSERDITFVKMMDE
ncbi:peroxide stress protein YaaA [Streptococcus ovuberis]|uniref:UPF0246 protein HF992_08640 n=1 Tax=Streptococcus ovuberis TaxID=1936207 RepID=A0A7X6N0U2_9STRE|nr:peroxide stress protein YaaA [Streptococcus ovuberis]NKZ20893.1 peroxide stress protein YaaA [Streptococcus ovuberis]